MQHTKYLSKHLKGIFFGGNWTAVNVNDTIKDITLNQANIKLKDCNTIAVILFHINYYVEGALPVFSGGDLTIRDKYSFDAPKFATERQWENFKTKVLDNASLLAKKISRLEDDKLFQPFAHEKYGNYYRNLHGTIEHTHYHLGQIVILKKLV